MGKGRVRVSDTTRREILSDWKTGAYSQRDLARKHDVSTGLIAKITKGVPKELEDVVSAGIQYRTSIAPLDEHDVSAVEEVVINRTRDLVFFRNASVKNVSLMMGKIGKKTSIDEHKIAQDAILKAKETVLGKSPETAIQINQSMGREVIDASPEDAG